MESILGKTQVEAEFLHEMTVDGRRWTANTERSVVRGRMHYNLRHAARQPDLAPRLTLIPKP